MRRIVLSAAARTDFAAILASSEATFGPRTRERYEASLVQALIDVATDPDRIGASARDDLRPGVRLYRLFSSRRRSGADRGTAKRPRHVLAFRASNANEIEIVRILHEAMDFRSQLSPDEER